MENELLIGLIGTIVLFAAMVIPIVLGARHYG